MSLSKNYLELEIQNKIGWAQLEKIKLMSTVCIYKIPCANFDKTYIGKTGRNFGVRLQEHRTKVESKTGRIFTRSLRASSLTEHNKSAHQRIRGFTTMHYINQLFTYFLRHRPCNSRDPCHQLVSSDGDQQRARAFYQLDQRGHTHPKGRTTGHEPWWGQLPT